MSRCVVWQKFSDDSQGRLPPFSGHKSKERGSSVTPINFFQTTWRHNQKTVVIRVTTYRVKVKVNPQQAEVAQGVLGRLRSRIFLTFGTTRVVGRQPYAPAAFIPGEIPGTRPQGTWFRRREPRKKFPVISPGIDPGTVRLVAQCLNHYATPGPPTEYQVIFLYMNDQRSWSS